MKKNILKIYLYLFTVVFMLGACNDPVFYTISQEVEPIEPRIAGNPANFAVYDGHLYTASGGSLYRYREGRWGRAPSPGGKIAKLESISFQPSTPGKPGEFLYAHCFSDLSGRGNIKQFDGSEWKNVRGAANSYNIQNIFAAEDTLFIGASGGSSFLIFYIDNKESDLNIAIKRLPETTGELSGAASDGNGMYYLCTKTQGIFFTKDPSVGAESFGGTASFAGMISFSTNSGTNAVVAITRSGNLFNVTTSGTGTRIASLGDRLSNGSLAIWIDKDYPENRLLLAGRQDSLIYTVASGYTYGYLELELDENGVRPGASFREPGRAPTSIIDGDNERYISTIGKYPVNFIFQAPQDVDTEMRLFASTQKNGVWSYRDRGGWQWNAED